LKTEEVPSTPEGILYYTIYTKGLNNGAGYIDVALGDDQLFKDYLQYLDIGIKPVRSYPVVQPPKGPGKGMVTAGMFAVNLSEVSAMTTSKPS
jgi:hypothetical protein